MRSKHETYRDPAELFASEDGKARQHLACLDQIWITIRSQLCQRAMGTKVHQQEIDDAVQAVPAGYTLLPAAKKDA